MTKRVHNFSAGPGVLPVPVLEAIQHDMLALPQAGISVLEISHRSKWFIEIYQEAQANLRQLLNIPSNYHVLFLQGGANLQFSMVPLNLLRGQNAPADYIVTGSWSVKAVKEAQREGEVRVLWNGKDDKFVRVPKQTELTFNSDAAYVHFTSNETIQGVEFAVEPDAGEVPLVCDMSSDFMSRPLDVNRYGLIYAGAQKNAGPSGATIVIIRDDLLTKVPDNLHTMLDYRIHVKKESSYNTPPVFSVYVIMLMTRWLMNDIGGLAEIAKINHQKASLLYNLIDNSNGFYIGHAQADSRSLMNVSFNLQTPELEQAFLSEAAKHDLHTLKGHLSIGGIRASIYNAMPLESVQALRDFMIKFQTNH
ncbi:3-phosphoserine/phosphohydroxythreonine transaminase [Anaerolineales bacterium HSG6]|nr:3-phosphoserine/phosphohydroxythreonine transaminase [Anaerolineales bacterium HSG6]MDM8530783.1 3-phosphoserine/phosphohydroxythreonine transaminase [Anaerolineales bacterium HSG25]